MICKNCGKEVQHPRSHMDDDGDGHSVYFCSPKAERSEAAPRCPNSATGSADARASDEADADSLGRSADKAVRRDGQPSSAEIAHHINAMMDELKWFYEHEIKLHLSP